MNLYEAIFTRKPVKKFRMETISSVDRSSIESHFRELPGLFGSFRSEMHILDHESKVLRNTGLTGIRAPHYLVFYSEEAPRCQMNAGFLMQHMALYLCTMGYGCCSVNTSALRKEHRLSETGKKAVGVLGFGESRDAYLRKRGDARRLPLEELCVFKEVPRQWVRQLVEAARQAPSAGNSQPWRFVVYDNRIHIFTKKHQVERFARYTLEEQNFGGMLANILIAAEEFWMDVDLIRLENISQKNFPNNQYVLSAIVRS